MDTADQIRCEAVWLYCEEPALCNFGPGLCSLVELGHGVYKELVALGVRTTIIQHVYDVLLYCRGILAAKSYI